MTARSIPEAQWDIIDASDYYDRAQAGLGNDFVVEARAAMGRIAGQPRLYPRVIPPVRGREVRQALVRRFPYTVVYEVTSAEVIIVAVVHVRRSQRVWRRRLSSRQP
jgi:plasmid stabilization system protein ParE